MGEVLLPKTSLTRPNVQQKCVSVPNPDGKLTRVTVCNLLNIVTSRLKTA